jgi:hypothetical protein
MHAYTNDRIHTDIYTTETTGVSLFDITPYSTSARHGHTDTLHTYWHGHTDILHTYWHGHTDILHTYWHGHTDILHTYWHGHTDILHTYSESTKSSSSVCDKNTHVLHTHTLRHHPLPWSRSHGHVARSQYSRPPASSIICRHANISAST